MLRARIVLWVIFYSVRFGTNPWKFFQVNAPMFNVDKHIFSKLDIDNHIPERWRLPQEKVTDTYTPKSFPIFLKPEWGQNSHGIFRVDSASEWQSVKPTLNQSFSYIAQQAAKGKLELEIFYVRKSSNLDDFAILSISSAENNSGTLYPINSIRNPDTQYKHCTENFSKSELNHLWSLIGTMGSFKIARVCCRCDSHQDLLNGDFEVVEINLFVPMPLVLLDANVDQRQQANFVRTMGRNLALLIKGIPADQPYRGIFFSKWALHRKIVKWKALKE